MGIYIKGNIEPPPHCFNCSRKIDPDNRQCNIDGHIFEETLDKLTCRRDEDCPLVEIPPHGRLVKASKVEFELCESNMPKSYRDFCRRVINDENLVPTIIPPDPAEKGET